MNGRKIVGLVLLVLGILALVYGGFSYTEDRKEASLGPLELAVEDKERVDIPTWLGVGLVVAGGLLLVVPKK